MTIPARKTKYGDEATSDRPAILFDPDLRTAATRPHRHRWLKNTLFKWVCRVIASTSVLILVVLLTAITVQGLSMLDWQFVTSPPDTNTEAAGVFPSLMGTVFLMILSASFALPLGVATAVFLEEFRFRQPLLRKAQGFLQLNIANLAGVPSVVYGIIGLTVFASMFGLFGNSNAPVYEFGVRYYDQYFNEAYRVLEVPAAGLEAPPSEPIEGMEVKLESGETAALNIVGPDEPFPEDPDLAARSLRLDAMSGRVGVPAWYYLRLPLGRGLLAGSLTLVLVILPIVIIASQEALRAVPSSLREGALGIGATPWQVVRQVTLPSALPGIMTGAIIAMSRAIGEAAPLLMIAGIVFITDPPRNLMGDFTALPLQIYNWAQRPQAEFHDLAASGIIVLLAVLLIFNAVAIFIRHKAQKPLS